MLTCLPIDLQKVLGRLPSIAVAYSGGVDSRFLVYAARLCGCDVLAIHAFGPHIPERESGYAREWASTQGIAFQEIAFDPLNHEEIRMNRKNRCYACKKSLFEKIGRIAKAQARIACDGTQVDDAKVFRPGHKALQELGILSPLAMAGMTKQAIREAAAMSGMDFCAQKARPCLLTRIAYDQPVDAALLVRIAQCEAALESELPGADFRLRLTPTPVLQIAGSRQQNNGELARIMEKWGFSGAAILETPAVSGFFDQAAQPSRQ